jgi:NAD(P)-dependent dehydrogenase (short-subunit alcohol dehydrogenase family)
VEIQGKVAVVTGGGSGIGAAVARKFSLAGARGVVVADINLESAQAVAGSVDNAISVLCDVTREADIQSLVSAARQRFGQVDIYFSNAGILGPDGGEDIDDVVWDRMWRVHGMAHVWAARAVVPEMLGRGAGYFIVTASAAGLLNVVESAAYGVTKHASVAFAEWMRIAYGRRGIRVSCLCPQRVDTEMTRGRGASGGVDGALSPEQVAEDLIVAMRQESFLVLPHPEVASYFRNKAQDYDRWIGGMQKMYARHTQQQ